jgi:AcrR family transcriptional regulator
MTQSKLAAGRQNGSHQVEEQRESILEAAQALFLRQGLEKTTMVDIAAAAGVTKVTLYRYFPNRDEIALAVYPRILAEIASLLSAAEPMLSLPNAKQLAQAMIRHFDTLRDAYRFFGVFDTLYLDYPPQADKTMWTAQRLSDMPWLQGTWTTNPQEQRAVVVLSAVIWFLEKVALRNDGTGNVQGIPVAEHLAILEEIATVYIEHLLAQQ